MIRKSRRPRPASALRRKFFRPILEVLENRLLLSTFTVINTADSGAGSLRQALLDANADVIGFDIPYGAAGHFYYRNNNAAGVSEDLKTAIPLAADSDSDLLDEEIVGAGNTVDPHWLHSWWSIRPASSFDKITKRVTLDGFTQPGSRANSLPIGDNSIHRIEIDGVNANGHGLRFSAGPVGESETSNEVRGLVLNRFPAGNISGAILVESNRNLIMGNFLGTDVSGSIALPNTVGVRLGTFFGSASVKLNHVGSAAPADRNVIVSQSFPNYGVLIDGNHGNVDLVSGNKIQGNYIGTNAAGTAGLAPTTTGIAINDSSDNSIGGPRPGDGNLISGNSNGITFGGFTANNYNVIAGNTIGLDASGSFAIPNSVGIAASGQGTIIGGTTAAERNVISGNNVQGIRAEGGTAALPILVLGNYIGTDATGSHAVPNSIGISPIGPNIVIGGTEPGAGNVISGNLLYGIGKGHGFGDGGLRTIQGNLIGTNATGTGTIPNGIGIFLAGTDTTVNLIGGTSAAQRNIISGNGTGVYLADSSAVVQGNYIGTDITGTRSLGNGNGVYVAGIFVPHGERTLIGGTTPGSGNVIAFNGNAGVHVDLEAQDRATILGNSIHDNGALGIELPHQVNIHFVTGPTPNDLGDADDGARFPNALQNYPVIASASSGDGITTVAGSLNSLPRQTFRIEFFSNAVIDPGGYGEGERYLGFINVVTDGDGNVSFTVPFPVGTPAGHFVTATATRLQREAWWAGDGNTIDGIGGHAGTLVGGTTFAPGLRGQAFSFDGLDDVVSTPLIVDYRGGVTFDAFIRTTDTSAVIMGDGAQPGQSGMSLFLTGGAITLVGQMGWSSQNISIVGPVIADGAFHHVAATWTGDTTPNGVKLYVDGALVGTATARARGNIGGRTIQLGGHTDTAFANYAGLIDEAHVAYRPLLAEEIQGIVNSAGADRIRGVSFAPVETSEFSRALPVFVPDQPPVADAGGPYFVNHGDTVTLDASGTTDVDEPNTNLTYQWDFDGDGQYDDATGMTPVFSTAGLPEGTWTPGLLVTDSSLKSSTDTAVLSIVCAPAGLVSWWAAENNANDLFDGNNGTLQNSVTFPTGKVGQAFNFNGSSYVSVPSATNLNLTGSLTIEGWVYLTANNFNNGLVFKGPLSGSQGSYSLGFYTGGSNQLTFRLNGSTGEGAGQVTGGTSLTPGQWYHIAATYDQSIQSIYVNGVLDGSRSYSSALQTNNSSLIIGGYYSTSHLFRGLVDEAAIYNRALSPSEIQDIVAADGAGKCLNSAPIANPDAYTINEEGTLIVAAPGVLGNDSDPDGNALTASLKGASNGTVTLNPDGSFSFTPTADFNGIATMTYYAHDDTAQSNPGLVTITVNTVNDAPVASGESYTVTEGNTLSVAATGVLGNDSDVDGNALNAVLTTGPSHGTLTLNTDGSFTYIHDGSETTSDSFTYKANDGSLDSNVVIVSITVSSVNDAPVANAGPDQGALEGATVQLNGSGSADVEGDTLTYSWSFGDGGTATGMMPSHAYADQGTYLVTLTVSDGQLTRMDTMTVAVINVAPTAGNDAAVTDEDLPVRIQVLGNDSDPAGAMDPLEIVLVTGGTKGITAIDTKGTPDPADDEIVYTPDVGATGSDSFTYAISDGDGGTATGRVTVQIRNLVDLSGRVFDDKDNDGLFEPADGEIGIGGVSVQLVNQMSGAVLATRTTAVDGTYTFDVNLGAGIYRVVAVQPADFLDGKETAGAVGGTVDNSQDSNQIADIQVGAPGAMVDAVDYLFAEIGRSQALGLVWQDFNNDGEVNFGETAIQGVAIELTGIDDRGQAVSHSAVTDPNGIYSFANLRPSSGAGYALRELQPAGFVDGRDSLGTVNGEGVGDSSVNDTFNGVVLLRPGSLAENYNFGEQRPPVDGQVVSGQTATIGFWHNKNGQNLIKALNGGQTSTQLGNWLATTLPNLYGGLGGKTNAQVTEFYKTLFVRTATTAAAGGPAKVDAQVLAVTLATYVTNQTLAGTTAAGYGFLVTENGVGTRTFKVGSNGAAFGVANNTNVTVLDLLLAVNSRSRNGLLYDLDGDGDAHDGQETLFRSMANDVFSAINEAGDI